VIRGGRVLGVGGILDFFADLADAFADFIHGFVDRGAGALGWAAGTGAGGEEKYDGEERKEKFHRFF
jgi:hypothetical protein